MTTAAVVNIIIEHTIVAHFNQIMVRNLSLQKSQCNYKERAVNHFDQVPVLNNSAKIADCITSKFNC